MKNFIIDHPDASNNVNIDTTKYDSNGSLLIEDSTGKPFAIIRIENHECSQIYISIKHAEHITPYFWTYKHEIYMIYDRESELLNIPFLN